MNEEFIDLKEQKPKGIIGKLVEAENKTEVDDRKTQMRIAAEAVVKIPEIVKDRENVKDVQEEMGQNNIDSQELASQIKQEVNREDDDFERF